MPANEASKWSFVIGGMQPVKRDASSLGLRRFDFLSGLVDHHVDALVALKWESAATNRRRVVTAETRQ
jgi:hypothetical protein